MSSERLPVASVAVTETPLLLVVVTLDSPVLQPPGQVAMSLKPDELVARVRLSAFAVESPKVTIENATRSEIPRADFFTLAPKSKMA